MKKIRRLICLLFVSACAVSAAYYVKVKMVEDTVAPTIEVAEDTVTVSVKDDMSALLQGVTAKDNRDGDLTDSIRVDNMSHFIGGPKRTVYYAVFDKSNNVGTTSRTVVYKDYEHTKLRVTEPFLYSVKEMENVDLGAYIEADDCIDGDISNQVRTILDSKYYSGVTGNYKLTLEVSNSAGDVTTVPMSITVIDPESDADADKTFPYLSDYLVYTKVGKNLDFEKYIRGVIVNGSRYEFDRDNGYLEVTAGDISISTKNLDLNKAGVYPVTYSYKAAGAAKAKTTLYVVVEGDENE